MHEFSLRVRWQGSTAGDYDKSGVASAPGKVHDLMTTTAPHFGGDPARWNPEELFGISLSLCHELTFLALAKKVRLDVRSYEDDVKVFLDTVDGVTRVTKVRLAPNISVAAGDPAKVKEMFEKAHKYCFVANSITAEVVLEPTIVMAASASASD